MKIYGACLGWILLVGSNAFADTAQARLQDARQLAQQKKYFQSARYAFSASTMDASVKPDAYAYVTTGLVKSGLYHAASYFFIKTLQTGDASSIRRVLAFAQDLLVHVGGDVLRKYLIRHTTYDDYDSINRSAYLYALGKDALLDGKADKAVGYFNGMSSKSPLWPFALQLRATSYAIQGQSESAMRDFRSCASRARDYSRRQNFSGPSSPLEKRHLRSEEDDLQARCFAGEARVQYELGRFDEADRTYDRIPKTSFVWPDILFEQAWNSFGRQEYNRTLGKLVSYKSPALKFVFNSEADVLSAQSYLALCLYNDANDVINEFNGKYTKVGEDVKRFIESNQNNLTAFYDRGREALRSKLHTGSDFYRLENRFVRSPYFQNLVAAENSLTRELSRVRALAASEPTDAADSGGGFPGFLEQVLKWRARSVKSLGGAFVKNSLLDYYQIIISDFEKMAFIKLEMLSRYKDKLLNRKSTAERSRGNKEPSRRDDQYHWGFNGEFWNDELGDYVFGLETECEKS